MILVRTLSLFLVFSVVLPIAASAQTQFSRDAGVAEVCRLTEEQRLYDAVTLAEKLKLQYPNDPDVLVADGTIAILLGDRPVAAEDFRDSSQLSPSPMSRYGYALCEMLSGQNLSASNSLEDSLQELSPGQDGYDDVVIAQSICAARTGKTVPSGELKLLQSLDPTVQELTALSGLDETIEQRSALLEEVLDEGMVNGVPRVVEIPALRLTYPSKGPVIEPSITDPEQQQSFASRFSSPMSIHYLVSLHGVVALGPPRPISQSAELVTVSVDNTVVGATNTPPFQLDWDTRTCGNGRHSVTFTATGNNGTELQSEQETVYVENTFEQKDSSQDAQLPAPTALRLWNLLRVEPAYKTAEYEVALADLSSHNLSGYETHILRAAALDPDYKDVRARIHPLFVGVAPLTFPVPDGTTLPSSLGLSSGSASNAGFWAGNPHRLQIALTFDDGPIPGPCHALLAALQAVDAPATFFVVGMRAVQAPDCLRQMEAQGDEVEDHTFTHPNLTQVMPQHVLQELVRTAVVIQAATGIWPRFIRPPGGNTNPFVLSTARACGMSGAFWTIDALPAEESGSPTSVSNWVIARARPGAIVLMHNGMAATIAAIPQLVAGLRAKGYTLVTVRQLADVALKRKL